MVAGMSIYKRHTCMGVGRFFSRRGLILSTPKLREKRFSSNVHSKISNFKIQRGIDPVPPSIPLPFPTPMYAGTSGNSSIAAP